MSSQKSHRRGEAVVQAILDAALQELAREGYHGLKYEAVAELAGVNKTTVYRRWPRKIDLVRDLFMAIPGFESTRPHTGSARGDLLVLGRRIATFIASPIGEAIHQLLVTEPPNEELAALCEELGQEKDNLIGEVLQSHGITGFKLDHVAPLLPGSILFRTKIMKKEISEQFLNDLVDILLAGSRALAVENRPRDKE